MNKEQLAEDLADFIFDQDSDVMSSPETLTETILEFLRNY